ncbi:ImmA/IrrE family metallo-endopeptidase [Desulfurivibrio sp. D14AmB]|uniref:ImmA/IrrE family metallo-endopeptidase n=1 Tax=Desulfurivibrio sp. D14AmB TaxID=3374370 RepID=UPI00376F38E2
MDLKILAHNVRRLRVAKRLSQSDLANIAGLSLPAVKSIELVKSEPRIRTMQAIAKALDVKLQVLFQPVRELRTVRFRAAKRMQNRENVLAEVAKWLDDFNYLEQCLNERKQFKLKEARASCSRARLAEAAGLCRKKLGLKSTEPIHDICGLLEQAGVKVFPVPMASDSFFGLSIGEEDGGPAVVVNVWERISVERRIFSAAHELGHLMLHPDAYDVTKVDESKEEEKEADRFAGYFLMPDDGFRKEWNEAAGLHFVDRVFKVKRIFRVSYKTVLSRLLEKEVVDKSIWMKFNIAYQKKFNRKLSFKEEPMGIDQAEPFGMQRFDFYEDRFRLLTREAVEKDKISLSRGAEMLRISTEDMQELLQNWEVIL